MLVYPMAAEINSSREEATSLFVYSKSDHVQYIRTRIMRIEHLVCHRRRRYQQGMI